MNNETQRYFSTKTYDNFPCSHRRWRHKGHCSFIHGYSRSFSFTFSCTQLNENGFVMDFGELSWLKAWLTDNFDHTMLIDSSDPLKDNFLILEMNGACKLVVYEDVGMEGTCKYVFDFVTQQLIERTNGRVILVEIEVRENNKNSAIYSLLRKH